MPLSTIFDEARQLHNVSDRLDLLADNSHSSQKHSSPSRETFVTPPRCWRCWLRRKWGRSQDQVRQIPDLLTVFRNGMSHWQQILRTTRINISMMIKKKKKNRLEIAREIISNVKKEMEKPRLTESVRSAWRDQDAPVIEKPPAQSEKV